VRALKSRGPKKRVSRKLTNKHRQTKTTFLSFVKKASSRSLKRLGYFRKSSRTPKTSSKSTTSGLSSSQLIAASSTNVMSNDENKTPSKVQYNSSATTYARSGASPGRSAFSPKVSFLVESPHTVREGNNDLGLEPILSVSIEEEAADSSGKVEASTA